MQLSYDALWEITLSRVCLFGKVTFCIRPYNIIIHLLRIAVTKATEFINKRKLEYTNGKY